MKLKMPFGPDTPRAAVIIVALSIVGILVLTLWYLVQPQPLLIQGEADATRIDMAARVDGRISAIPVKRGENIAGGALLIVIDNPELIARLHEARAAKTVADAELARIDAGT